VARRRVKIGKGVYRDRYGISAIVRVRPHPQQELRFPFGTALKEIQRQRGEARTKLLAKEARLTRGRFKADAAKYLKLVRHLASWGSRCCEIDAWVKLYHTKHRSALTAKDVLRAREIWIADHYAPKTVNHRVRALRHLYRTLDGADAVTPCDGIKPLAAPAAEPRLIPVKTLQKVARQLTDRDTLARFLVLTSTGRRPSELARALPTDVDLRRRLWIVRTGKGGHPTPLYLTEDMTVAWRLFSARALWGRFDVSDYAKDLYAAGWPQQWIEGGRRRRNAVRPYNARHSVAITLGEAGAQWEDLRDFLGHSDVKTTRIYTGVLRSRLKATSDKLTGRLGWKSLIRARKAG